VEAYYDARAAEYDEWYHGNGRFEAESRPGWHEELRALTGSLSALPAARTLDAACGTGFLTQHLRGDLTLLDRSERMLAVASERLPQAAVVRADALSRLPFADGAFDRVLTGHFYGHLQPADRRAFLREARRVAPGLVVVDSAARPGVEREGVQERMLNDGSRWRVYKRYFDPDELLGELGGGRIVHSGRWFLAVQSP
jgi:SAM-dependent methyltransferase